MDHFAVSLLEFGDNDKPGGDSGDNGQTPDTGDNLSAKAKARIEWLTSKEEIAEALRDVGEAIVEFRSADELRNVVPWLTPSLAPFLSVTPEVFEEISPTATEPYELTLVLASSQPLSATLGGTLHIRQSGEGGELGRTYARPLGITVQHVSGDENDDETEDDAGDADDDHQPGIAVAGSADSEGGEIAPLEIISIFGLGIGPADLFGAEFDEEGQLNDYVADVQVLFDGVTAPILAASENEATINYVGGSPGMVCAVVQFNVTVPADVESGPDVPIQVWSGNHPSKATVTLAIEVAADSSGN